MSRSFTFEFLILERFDAASLHAFRRVAAGSTRLNRVLMQIVAEPPEITIANEGITCQVSVKREHRDFVFRVGGKVTDVATRTAVSPKGSDDRGTNLNNRKQIENWILTVLHERITKEH